MKKASHNPPIIACRPLRSAGVRQDRFFAYVDSTLVRQVNDSPRFKSAGNGLHPPLAGFSHGPSFKSRDDHANIQFTFMVKDGPDEWPQTSTSTSPRLGHGFEVDSQCTLQEAHKPLPDTGIPAEGRSSESFSRSRLQLPVLIMIDSERYGSGFRPRQPGFSPCLQVSRNQSCRNPAQLHVMGYADCPASGFARDMKLGHCEVVFFEMAVDDVVIAAKNLLPTRVHWFLP